MEKMEKAAMKYDSNRKFWNLSDSDESDIENDIDVDKLAPLEIGPNENRLQYNYCLWFARKNRQRARDYSQSLHFVGRCATVEQWWSLYCHLKRPTAFQPYRELSLFKQGIKPMWEDPSNAKGGQWLIRLKRQKIDRAWENVCMAMLGEQFLVGPEICGIVLTTKYPDYSLSVWNRTATDHVCTARIRDTLRRILNFPLNQSMEYKVHCDSLKHVSRAIGANVVHKS